MFVLLYFGLMLMPFPFMTSIESLYEIFSPFTVEALPLHLTFVTQLLPLRSPVSKLYFVKEMTHGEWNLWKVIVVAATCQPMNLIRMIDL
ncbi:Glutamyl-tRNA reductase [Frankliniella fusca]|uniref:Glutamyl-tRNA reductase n=1 Tax=Frankliniella fusca TaxID=407009 RepID=A0AAE1LL16_9NEOP|nr:Glutamyl-tRNA reductase [Frankliniella fusca]